MDIDQYSHFSVSPALNPELLKTLTNNIRKFDQKDFLCIRDAPARHKGPGKGATVTVFFDVNDLDRIGELDSRSIDSACSKTGK